MLPLSSTPLFPSLCSLLSSHASTGQNSESILRVLSSLTPMFLVNSRPPSFCRVPSIRLIIFYLTPLSDGSLYSQSSQYSPFFSFSPPRSSSPATHITILSTFSPFLWICPYRISSISPHLKYLPLPTFAPSSRSVIPFPFHFSPFTSFLSGFNALSKRWPLPSPLPKSLLFLMTLWDLNLWSGLLHLSTHYLITISPYTPLSSNHLLSLSF